MKFIKFFAVIISLILFTRKSEKSAPAAVGQPVETPTALPEAKPVEKPFIDKRIKGLRDVYAFTLTRELKPKKDANVPKTIDEFVDAVAKHVCAGRIQMHEIDGVKRSSIKYCSALFCAGRANLIEITFDFIDRDENNFTAIPRREDLERLKDLHKQLTRFLN